MHRRVLTGAVIAAAAPLVLAGCSSNSALTALSSPAATASTASSGASQPSAAACAAIKSAWVTFAATMDTASTVPDSNRLVTEIASLGTLQAMAGQYMSNASVNKFMGALSDLGYQLTTVENDLNGLGNFASLSGDITALLAAQQQATADEQAVIEVCGRAA